jgi:signal transduction histidine kinase
MAARSRARRLADAAGTASVPAAIAYAADLFVALAVERTWRVQDTDRLVEALGQKLGADPIEIRLYVLVAALRAPQLAELPPLVALDVQLELLRAAGSVLEGSIWVRDEAGRPACVLSVGDTATTRRFRAVAAGLLDLKSDGGDRGTIMGVAVRRWHSPWGALVVRARNRELVGGLLEEAAAAISLLVERDFLLQRSAAREQALVSASERRLARLGFDLHDGALQQVAALRADLRRLGARTSADLNQDFDSLEKRVGELDRDLRELAHSLEPASLLRRPLESVVDAETSALSERSGIDVATKVTGDFSAMTPSQKIALIRVLQEACTNVREHSGASNVEVTLTATRSCVELLISDDGGGFEVTRTLQDAAQRGRLGVVGSSERIRLLGGTFDLRSRPGGPTTLSVTLPRWQPLAAEDESSLQLAY